MIIFIHVSLFSFSPFLINRSHQELHMRQTLLPHVLPGRQTGCSIRRRHVSYLIYIHMPHLLLLVLHLPFKSTFLAVLLYIVLDFMYKYGPEPDVFFFLGWPFATLALKRISHGPAPLVGSFAGNFLVADVDRHPQRLVWHQTDLVAKRWQLSLCVIRFRTRPEGGLGERELGRHLSSSSIPPTFLFIFLKLFFFCRLLLVQIVCYLWQRAGGSVKRRSNNHKQGRKERWKISLFHGSYSHVSFPTDKFVAPLKGSKGRIVYFWAI